jgi:gliding motility-associated protein GldM
LPLADGKDFQIAIVMALPREPRQKMINMMYLVLTALLALNVSSEILNAFKTVNHSLETTNTTVDRSTKTIMASLQSKLNDSATAARARIWYPKAVQVTQISKSLFDRIQSLKDRILREAGGDPKDSTKKYKEGDLEVTTRIMIEKGEGKQLLKDLSNYRTSLLGIDSTIAIEFKNSLPINLTKPKSDNRAGKTWEGAYFHMVPSVAGLTILSKFQMDVKTSENRVVQFLHNKVGEVNVVFDNYAAIVGQSSEYLMPGQDITIKAGVGAFSKKAQPTIIVNNTSVPIGNEGYAETKLPGGAVGDHTINVTVSFMNQETGKMDTRTIPVKYTVGQANASIALEKMNVLYIGVDNPVLISASGGGDERVNTSVSGGGLQLTKQGGGHYIARVSSITDDAKITVSVDGKVVGISQFRVRTIPQAQAYVGGQPSGANVNAAAFKAQGGVGAGIKDFPFELQYTVVSYTLTVDTDEGDILSIPATGNSFEPIRAQLNTQVKAGKMVTIDNIKVKGPDGAIRSAPSLIYYIK